MPRHLLQESVDRLAGTAAPPLDAARAAAGVRADTLLVLAAVLCFVLCAVALALAARRSGLCNPSAFSLDASPPNAPPCKGIEREALRSLPTVSWAAPLREDEAPECAICLAEFARGDEVRVLPTCGHAFHAACVDAWLLSSSTCPSCRRALVDAPSSSFPPTKTEPPATCSWCAAAAAEASAASASAGRGCRSPAQ